jgi:hypothetical protein
MPAQVIAALLALAPHRAALTAADPPREPAPLRRERVGTYLS